MGVAETMTVSPGADLDVAVVAVGDAAEDGHRFALAAGDDVDDAVVGEEGGVAGFDQDAVGVDQIAELPGDLDVLLETAAEGGDLAAVAGGDVDDLLDARDQRGESGDDDAAFGFRRRLAGKSRRRRAPTGCGRGPRRGRSRR